ncbi:M1 family peptidase [Nocardioides immobilis]|uniref:Aminopeptidase N n=1 Tax=Nocardioides immobilis TaxID=2049295 RepID=A0A417XT52_9ACTN|nr:M1 family metallopeptidase [Nocardioides immobilis]RHW23421.1 M1 family peptidase [Nocardioides immobilis]
MRGTDPYVPGHGDGSYGVTHYDLTLSYRPAGNRIDGLAVLACVAHEEVTALSLDLHHLRVAKVSVSRGGAVRSTHRSGAVRVTLSSPIAAGEEFTVTVKYSGSPVPVPSPSLGEAGWEELEDGAIVAAQPHGAPSWFPCNDRPDDKATYSITVSAPQEYHVAVSGELVSSTRGGSTVTWAYEQRSPMATYLATVQIGRYVVRQQPAEVPMRVVIPPDLRGAGFDASFGRQPEMMAFFVDRFGPYPFPSYTVVITDDDLEIPLESQSLSTFGRNFARDDWDAIRLVAHELAHQWFGNAVTLRQWRDIWLHEGFACYAEWLWSEESGGQTAAEWAEHHHQKLSDLPQDLLLGDPGPDLMFDDRVYKRGALTLHALRLRIGEDAFFDVLRAWVARHKGGSVDTADFVSLCDRISGESLIDLFESWLGKAELPSLSA